MAALVRARSPARWRPVPITTRPRRRGEVDGTDYRFLAHEEAEALAAAGLLLEWAQLGGHLYGTPREPVESRLSRGEPVLLNLELPGALQVQRAMPDARLVLLVPPGREVPADGGHDAAVASGCAGQAADELVDLLSLPRTAVANAPHLPASHANWS